MPGDGLLVVISAPSGTGKGTLLKSLKEKNNKIKLSVSATTRKPREGEEEGKNYYFRTIDQFKEMIRNDELVEWAEYCDNYYGTPRKYVEEFLSSGYDVLLEIETKGAANIRKQFPDSVSVFILPPSLEELKNRIVGRGTEKPETIMKRLDAARNEIHHLNMYDYVVVNDDVDIAVNDISSILTAEKLRYRRNENILSRLGMG